MFKTSLNTSRSYRNAAILIPLAFGLWSVLLGIDSNWDLRNYHLYNAFAFLNGKLAIDLAPGGFQSYFNPLLDVPYYLAVMHLPPRLTGFLMGALHGLNFILLLGICRKALPALAQEDRYRVPVLLALAGCLTVNFLSELGSTMGDNTTSLFCLAAILAILHAQPRPLSDSGFSLPMLFAAGLLMGLGAGLKLTNAIYAVALCAGLLTFSLPPLTRIRIAFVFGIGVLAGFAVPGGYWFFTMWQTFGNPLFPQFGNLFPNPLAAPLNVADTSWIPKGIWQQVFWPFIISADAQKAGQIELRQIVWAFVYALLIAFAIAALFRRERKTERARMDPAARYIVVVVIVGFVLWMKMFGIYRYLVPMDLLAPLTIFILFSQLLPYAKARRASAWAIGLCTLVVLAGGLKTWGHEPWGDKSFHVDVPALPEPARSTVLITQDDPPWGWIAVAFPPSVAFAQVKPNFPTGPAFPERIKNMLAQRGGPAFALFQGHYDFSVERVEKVRRIAESWGLMKTSAKCSFLRRAAEKLRIRATVNMVDDPAQGTACRLELSSKGAPDVESANRAEREKAKEALRPYGLSLSEQGCASHRAGIGDTVYFFQWCPVVREAAP
jgi:hypothetical protein